MTYKMNSKHIKAFKGTKHLASMLVLVPTDRQLTIEGDLIRCKKNWQVATKDGVPLDNPQQIHEACFVEPTPTSPTDADGHILKRDGNWHKIILRDKDVGVEIKKKIQQGLIGDNHLTWLKLTKMPIPTPSDGRLSLVHRYSLKIKTPLDTKPMSGTDTDWLNKITPQLDTQSGVSKVSGASGWNNRGEGTHVATKRTETDVCGIEHIDFANWIGSTLYTRFDTGLWMMDVDLVGNTENANEPINTEQLYQKYQVLRCASDPVYFYEHFYQETGGKPRLRDVDKELLRAYADPNSEMVSLNIRTGKQHLLSVMIEWEKEHGKN